MNIATIQENRYDARKKYAEYMKAVKQRHNAEYVALKNAYRELSRGKQVIDLFDVMKTAGVDAKGRPRLAIVRADHRTCWFFYDGNRPVFFHDRYLRSYRSHSIELPAGTFPPFRDLRDRERMRISAIVPSIPPSLMPESDLKNYHILWEAEWETVPIDPLLLKHLGKNLYVVLAQWDLTPLERSVLAARPMN